MGFAPSDIARSMEVYTLDNVYLGTVLGVTPGPASPVREQVAEDAQQSGSSNGELLGPMPTQTIGNSGPAVQSAHAQYASQPVGASSLGRGRLTIGHWWGLVGRRSIPLEAVQTVSLERVILKLRRDELPD